VKFEIPLPCKAFQASGFSGNFTLLQQQIPENFTEEWGGQHWQVSA